MSSVLRLLVCCLPHITNTSSRAQPGSPEIADGPENVWYSSLVQDFHVVPKSELPDDMHAGVSYKAMTLDVPRYLKYLQQRAQSLGARIIRAPLPTGAGLPGALNAASILAAGEGQGKVDAFVNATGLGARELIPEEKDNLYPIRGQTVLVKGEAKRISTVWSKDPYVASSSILRAC